MKNLKKFNEFLDPMGKWTSDEETNQDNDVQNPKYTDKNGEDFLLRLGIDVTKATGEYEPGVPEEPNVGIRPFNNKFLYTFKVQKDCDNFKKYLTDKGIEFDTREDIGARYPHKVIINKK